MTPVGIVLLVFGLAFAATILVVAPVVGVVRAIRNGWYGGWVLAGYFGLLWATGLALVGTDAPESYLGLFGVLYFNSSVVVSFVVFSRKHTAKLRERDAARAPARPRPDRPPRAAAAEFVRSHGLQVKLVEGPTVVGCEIPCARRASFYASSEGRVSGTDLGSIEDATLCDLEDLVLAQPHGFAMVAAHKGTLRVIVLGVPNATDLFHDAVLVAHRVRAELQRDVDSEEPDGRGARTDAGGASVGGLFERSWPDQPERLTARQLRKLASVWKQQDRVLGWGCEA